MRRSARREDGFTLIELMVATLVGTIVLLAAFALVDVTVGAQAKNEKRLDALQHGRFAMEQISRSVRRVTCSTDGKTPFETAEGSATATQLSYYSGVVAPATGAVTVEKRRLAYEPGSSGARGRIVERVYLNKGTEAAPVWLDGTGGQPDTPDRTSVLASDIEPLGTTPVFRYARFDPAIASSAAARLIPLAAPVTGEDLKFIAQVHVAFATYPTQRVSGDDVRIPLDSRIGVRAADPTNPTGGLACG